MHQLGHKIVLPRTKADLTMGKGCLLLSINLLVPSWYDEESATPLEESIRNAEFTAKTGWRHPSGCSKLTAKGANLASWLCNMCLKSYEGKLSRNLERRLQISGRSHANITNAKEHGTKPANAPHWKRGEVKQRTRQAKVTRVRCLYYREIG
jgi:hypothetical protein